MVKRFNDWITDNIAYDTDLFLGLSKNGSRKPYELLPLRRTTCGGFSQLFKEMADMAGIEAVYITGFAKSYLITAKDKMGNHAWNGVKINGTWYLLDVTANGRRGYKNGVFSEKREYKDTNLFIHPKAKILGNLPYEEKYQFIDNLITYDEFMSAPRLQAASYAYDINFITDLQKIITLGREEREGGNQFGLFDKLVLKSGIAEIALKCPDNVLIKVSLKNKDDEKEINASYAYRNGKNYICQFSPPRPGTYKASIMAKYHEESGYFRTVYSFTIVSSHRGMLLPRESNTLLDGGLVTLHNIEVHDSDLTGKNGYYMLDLIYPEDLSLYTALYDVKGDKCKDMTITSYLHNRKRFYYKVPDNGTYYIKVYSKKADNKDGYHQLSALVKLENAKKTDAPLPPSGEIVFYKAFLENGFSLPENLKVSPDNNGVYQLSLKRSPDLEMDCSLKDGDNKKQKFHSDYHTDGNNYTFYFTSAGTDIYTARIYQVNPDGKYNSICYFTMQGNRIGQKLPLNNTFSQYRLFHENGFKLISEGLSRITNGVYELKIRAPKGFEMSSALKDDEGKRYNTHQEYDKDGREYTFHYTPPGNGKYFGYIYLINKDGKYRTIGAFTVWGQGRGVTAPFPGAFYRYKKFYENGFKLVSENISDGKNNLYEVRIEAPDDFNMACGLRDKNNKNQTQHYIYDKRENDYLFHFTPPGSGEYTAKIYEVNNEGRFNTIATFKISGQARGKIVQQPNRLYYNNQFDEHNFQLINENITKPTGEFYAITIKAPDGFKMSSNLKDKDGNNYRKHYQYSKKGNQYTFHFIHPGRDESIATIYGINEEGRYKSLITFNPGKKTERKTMPIPGHFYMFKSFDESSFKLISENISQNRKGRSYQIIIECPETFTMNCHLKDSEGKRMKDYYTFEKDENRYIFNVTYPGQGRHTAKIFGIDQEDKWIAIATFSIER